MTISERLLVVIDADTKGAIRGVAALGATADKTLGSTQSKMDKFANSSIKIGAGLVGVSAVAAVGLTKMAQGASDLNESISKNNVVFGRNGKEVEKWAGTLSKSFGLSKAGALEASGAFGSMFRTTGIAQKRASDMSRTMVELAADMASFNNEDPSEMLDRLRSGLAGEAEPLRRFGVLLSEAGVASFAYANGIAKAGEKLTEGQKVQARYGLILEQTKLQQGDFARTADGAANKQRQLAAEFKNMSDEIGKAFLPVMSTAIDLVGKSVSAFNGLNASTGGAVGKLATVATVGGGAAGALVLAVGAAAKLKVSMDAASFSTGRLSAALKTVGAVTTLVAALQLVKTNLDEISQPGKDRAAKFADLAAGAQFSADEFDKLVTRINRVDKAFQGMGVSAGQIRSRAVGEQIQGFFGADVSKGVFATRAELDALNATYDRVLPRQRKFQQSVLDVRVAVANGLDSDKLMSSSVVTADAVENLAQKLGVDLYASGPKGEAAVNAVSTALQKMLIASGAGERGTKGMRQAVDELALAEDKLKDRIEKRTSATIASFSSQIAANQAVANLGEILNSDASANEKSNALLDTAAAKAKVAADNYESLGVSVEKAGGENKLFKDALVELRDQFPRLRAEIDAYIGRLDVSSKPRTTKIDADTSAADAKINNLFARWAGRSIAIGVRTVFSGLFGNGDEPERKTGGPVPGSTNQAVPIIAHGGEYVLSADVVKRIKQGRASQGAAGSNSTSGAAGSAPVINLTVQTLVPTANTGRIIAESLRPYLRTGGAI